jgi:transmembrane sensor
MIDNEAARYSEQAAAWRVRLAELRLETCEEFELWLASHPRNATAWRNVQTPWELLEDHATAPKIIQLRRRALAYSHGPAPDTRSRLRRYLKLAAGLGLSAAAVILAASSWLLWQSYHFDIYQTRVGERRTETLSDGSELTLDSNSEVRVRYGRHSRELVLSKGQALFSVAHDVLRPFSVAANRHQIIATGTSFNVDLLGSQLLVTLLEGHVVVMPHEGDNDPAGPQPPLAGSTEQSDARIDLDAGEQLVLAQSHLPSITRVNVDHAVAWERGRLVFEDESLGSVVRRVGRYSAHSIVIADETTSQLRISGVFHEGDVEGFIGTLVNYLPVRAQRQQDGSVVLSAAAVPQELP